MGLLEEMFTASNDSDNLTDIEETIKDLIKYNLVFSFPSLSKEIIKS